MSANSNDIITASRTGNNRVVKQHIKNGADIHQQNDAAIMWAASMGHYHTTRTLLRAGANPNARPETITIPAAYGYSAIVELLMLYGADHQVNDNEPLLQAVRHNNTSTVEVLLQHGAIPTTVALEIACLCGNTTATAALLQAGANPFDNHSAPLRRAVEGGFTEIVKLLLATKLIDTEIVNQNIDIALHLRNWEMMYTLQSHNILK